MTNRHLPSRRPDHPQPDPPMRPRPPRGFFDCRGEWQGLDQHEDRDAGS